MTNKLVLGGMLPLLCVLLIAGCSGSSTSPSGQGSVRIMLVDSPADLGEVNIVVTKVDVHATGADSMSGWMTVNSDTATYDLLKLTNGVNSIIGSHMLPSGKYTQIRLTIGAGSNVVVDGISYSLNVPSATGLKLNHNFTIEDNQLYLLTLDFDAAKSVRLMNDGTYRLQPVIRVISTVVSGAIYGVISPASVESNISTVIAGDTVSTISQATDGYFKLVALPAGIYSLTITPHDTTYRDTTITGISVVPQLENNIGTVTLSKKL